MGPISIPTHPAVRRFERLALAVLMAFVITTSLARQISAQCWDHPESKTALKFNNESSYELTFFIDDDEKGITVPSRSVSVEQEVEPGMHILRARAIVRGKSFGVWLVNEVPRGQICMWTIEDPQRDAARTVSRYLENCELSGLRSHAKCELLL